MDAPLFPELERERSQLTHARACRDAMIRRLSAVDPDTAADAITKEYIEVTVADALADLHTPGAGDFFGRIDEEGGDQWYVGRRHIETDEHDPVVVDWRAPIAAPFYRATVADPVGLKFRRRFTLAEGDLIAYLDEHLDDPDGEGVASGIPDPVLAEIGAARTGAMREIVATIQAEQDIVIRAPIEGCLVVQGGPGTGKTAVGLHRAAYLLFEHRRRLLREKVLVVGPNKVFLDYIGDVLPSLGERSVQQKTVVDLAVPSVDVTAADPPEVARLKGDPRMLKVLDRAARNLIRLPDEPVETPAGSRILVFGAEEIAGVRITHPDRVLYPDAGITKPGTLTVQSADTGFDSTENDGFHLYRVIAGDFSISVQIKSFNNVGFHMPGLMVRRPFQETFSENSLNCSQPPALPKSPASR